MNWDRQNIMPDYQLNCSFHTAGFEWNAQIQSDILANIEIYISLTTENNGRRPLAITDISLDLSFYPDSKQPAEWLKLQTTLKYKINPIVIKPQSLEVSRIYFETENYANNVEGKRAEADLQQYKNHFLLLPYKRMWARLVNGTELDCNLTVIK